MWDRRHADPESTTRLLETITATLAHRGPDDAGTFVRGGLGLGHRRLAVIDCSPTGHQPMASADGRWVVATNAEIYNYVELRAELARSGYRFRGTSDTEVLVAALERWGLGRTLERANGMFAFAAWDESEQELHLARDRFGEKPLYYGWAGECFVFGSELKALRAHPAFDAEVDRNALTLYFRHNCIPSPWSVYRRARKVPPGTCITVRRRDRPGVHGEPVAFWSLAELADTAVHHRRTGGLDASVDELEQVLGSAVALRLRSDVPVGAFLSGGVDSSLVVALMQAHAATVRTFTIAFEDAGFDESRHAAAVARHLGTEHCELTVTARETLDVVPSLPVLYDEPFADSSQVPQAVLARLTRRHVTVALSGDGGDELFAGYNRHAFAAGIWPALRRVPRPVRRGLAAVLGAVPPHRWDALLDRERSPLPARLRVRMPGTKLEKLARVLPADDLHGVYRVLASHLDDPAGMVLGATEPSTAVTGAEGALRFADPVERMLYLDSVTYLPDDILTKVDRATMAVALETRLPFLDPAVAEFAWRTPLDQKLHQGTGKWLLRRLLHRFVPPELVERPKAGFGIPLAQWLRGPLRPWAQDLLDPARLTREGFLATDRVRRMWDEHTTGRRDWPYELWDVLMFQAWLDEWGTAAKQPAASASKPTP